MYLPVPLWGLVCDRYNTRLVSVLSGLCFGAGYGLGGIAYSRALGPATMIVSFVAIGLGTSGMYLSAVSTCAKNFGRGSWRGISLSVPIAAFGLSGLWISIVGSRFFTPEGGDLDVGRYFTFLACLMTVVGIIGGLTLQVMDEGKVMDDQSSISTGSALLGEDPSSDGYYSRGYGATNTQEPRSLEFSISAHASSSKHASVVSSPISKAEEDPLAPEIQQKDPNEKTRLFFTDHTMWLLSAGFFLVAGVGDAYQNNIGSIVLSLPSDMAGLSPHGSGVATQVMTIALTSTFARLFTGTMSDYLAPSEPEPLFAADVPLHERKRSKLEVSRVAFLLMFSVIHATGYLILASSYFENHPQLVTLSSGLVGLGYGAAFSLVPIIISVVWGVDNFATNWGFVAMFPAGGALVWSAVYATVYERFKQEGSDACMGYNCYGFTAWGWFLSVIAAIILWTWVWRGRGGWYQRETVV